MRLIDRYVIGTGLHRSGWPCAKQALTKQANGHGLLLDDFTDASFSYTPIRGPHIEPWAGIFHHPATVKSPLNLDRHQDVRQVERHRLWRRSVPNLRGAIVLCHELKYAVEDWLKIPARVLWHPTETNVPTWNETRAAERPLVVQAGFYLRNTRAIYQLDAPGWDRMRLTGGSANYAKRDLRCRQRAVRPEHAPHAVMCQERANDADYDALLARSVVLSEIYGAAANNLVVECMVRGTPIIVPPLPAIREYLGEEYPLFCDDFSRAQSRLDWPRLREAHACLLERAKLLPSFDQFATAVRGFVDALPA